MLMTLTTFLPESAQADFVPLQPAVSTAGGSPPCASSFVHVHQPPDPNPPTWSSSWRAFNGRLFSLCLSCRPCLRRSDRSRCDKPEPPCAARPPAKRRTASLEPRVARMNSAGLAGCALLRVHIGRGHRSVPRHTLALVGALEDAVEVSPD